jgi:hypothetical protein
LQGMSGKALRDLLSSVGRPFSGNKPLLVARLMGAPPPPAAAPRARKKARAETGGAGGADSVGAGAGKASSSKGVQETLMVNHTLL